VDFQEKKFFLEEERSFEERSLVEERSFLWVRGIGVLSSLW
jgi:hypothetical protein